MEGLLEKIVFKMEKDGLLKKCRHRDKVYKRMFIYTLLRGHDLRNATTSRDLTMMRKRLENDLYIDIKKNGNGGK